MLGWLVGAVAVNEVGKVVGAYHKREAAWEITVDHLGRYWLEDFKKGRLSQHKDEAAALKAARKIR